MSYDNDCTCPDCIERKMMRDGYERRIGTLQAEIAYLRGQVEGAREARAEAERQADIWRQVASSFQVAASLACEVELAEAPPTLIEMPEEMADKLVTGLMLSAGLFSTDHERIDWESSEEDFEQGEY